MNNESAKQQEKRIRMTTEPVEKLICKLAIPTIISMLVTTFYNMADTFFVGKLDNTSATGAIGVAFPLMAIIQAVGFFFGHGSGNYISRMLGSGHQKEAEHMAATGFTYALSAGFLISIFGNLFLVPLSKLLGATDTILPFAMDYIRIILIGAPFMTASLVLNNQLRFQGNALYSMIGLASGGILNIILDPIFIFTFDMEVAGAALATIISQTVSFVLLWVGARKGDNLKIHFRNFSFKGKYFLEICRGGTPSLGRQGLASVATTCLNNMIKPYGDPAIAAMAIVSRIVMFINSAMIGFGQGFQPVCGFNYGAGLYRRVRRAFFFCLRVSVIFLVICCTLGFVVAPYVVSLFQSNDQEVTRIGALALRCQLSVMPVMAFVVMANMMLQTIGKVGRATLLASARQGVCFIPAVLVLPVFFDLWGVLLAQPVADVLSFVIALPITLQVLRGMREDGIQE